MSSLSGNRCKFYFQMGSFKLIGSCQKQLSSDPQIATSKSFAFSGPSSTPPTSPTHSTQGAASLCSGQEAEPPRSRGPAHRTIHQGWNGLAQGAARDLQQLENLRAVNRKVECCGTPLREQFQAESEMGDRPTWFLQLTSAFCCSNSLTKFWRPRETATMSAVCCSCRNVDGQSLQQFAHTARYSHRLS